MAGSRERRGLAGLEATKEMAGSPKSNLAEGAPRSVALTEPPGTATGSGTGRTEAEVVLWRKAKLFTLAQAHGWGLMENAALISLGGRIRWIGADGDLPAGLQAQREYCLDGALLGPGLIDAHTHLVYAGDRADEFEARLQGKSYAEIAREGGGSAPLSGQPAKRAMTRSTPSRLHAAETSWLRASPRWRSSPAMV